MPVSIAHLAHLAISSCLILVIGMQPVCAQSESSPDALSAFSKAANLQNNHAYDLAAEGWQEFLKKHGKDPKGVEARYNLGVCFMQLDKLDEARKMLRQVIESKTKIERREEAFLNLGWILYSQALKDQPALFPQADQVFAELLEQFPNGEQRDQALFFRGESLYLQGKGAEAVKAYDELVKQHPDSEMYDDGLYALGVTQEELGQYAEAGKIYDSFLEKFADHDLVPEVKMRKAETVLRAGDFADAEKRFAEVAAIADFSSADHALYRQGYAVARQDRFEDAGKLFARLISDYPKSVYAADAKMAAARSFFRAEKPDIAAPRFDSVLKDGGKHAVEAAHWRARLYLQKNDAAAALKLAEEYLPQAAEHPFLINLTMDKADSVYELEGRRAESVPIYIEIARAHPDHLLAPQALYNAAYAQMELQKHEESLKLANAFLKAYPDHDLVSDVKNVAAECLLKVGKNDRAAAIFSELAATNPDRDESTQWQIREALAWYAKKDYGKSLERLEAGLPTLKDPAERAEAFYLIGMNQLALKQFKEAQVAFQKSLETQPGWRQTDEVLVHLSRAQRRLGDTESARETVARVFQEFPDSEVLDQALYRAAEYAYAAEDYSAAISSYGKLVEQFPDSEYHPFALYGQGWAKLRLEEFETADATFTELIDKHPDHVLVKQAVYARAMSRQQAGRFDESLSDIERYLGHDPKPSARSDALYVRGLSQAGQRKYAQATATFQSILDDDPKYSGTDKVLYELAWVHQSSDKQADAQKLFQRLVQEFPQSPLAAEAFYHVGEEAYDKQEYSRAAQAYQMARDRTADNDELGEKTNYKLGWSWFQEKKYEEAKEAFSKQLEVRPEGALAGDGQFMRGECQFKLEDYEGALQSYQQAVGGTVSSDVIVVLAHLHGAQAAAQLKKWPESIRWLETIAVKHPQSNYMPQVKYEMAVAQQNLGNVQVALKLFDEVADEARGEAAARARFMMGELHYAQKQYVEAIREFRLLMFGFEQNAGGQVKAWQAKAGFEAGQCAGVLASQQTDRENRDRFIALAKKFFDYVRTQHPESAEAAAATEQLRKYDA